MKQLEFLKNVIRRTKWYFKNDEDEIMHKNIHSLGSLSVVAVALIVVLSLLAFIIIKDWRPTVYHLMFVAAALIICAVVQIYLKVGKFTKRSVNGMCVAFWIVMFIFVILIDVFSNPMEQSCFMPLLCVVLPAGFILPMRLTYSVVGFFEIVYVIGVMLFKHPVAGRYDIFTSVCALGMSATIYQFIMFMRAHDYEIYVRYEKLSKHDPLITELYNKQSGYKLITKYLNRHNPKVSCAFLVLDVDDFKNINDTCGHYAGDKVLCRVGDVLKKVFHSEDIIVRFGGDEFIVFAKGLGDEAVVMEKCGFICKMLQVVSKNEIGVPVGCSIGAVVAGEQPVDGFNALFCQADAALYESKDEGKNRYTLRRYSEAEKC